MASRSGRRPRMSWRADAYALHRQVLSYVFTLILVSIVITVVRDQASSLPAQTIRLVALFTITLSAWLGGFGHGLLALGLIVVSVWQFDQPLWGSPNTRLLLSAAIGMLASLVLSSLRQSRRQAKGFTQSIQAILDTSVDLIFMIDASGELMHVSQSAVNLLDCDRQIIVGKTWRDIGLMNEGSEEFDKLCEQVLETGKPARGKFVSQTSSYGARAFDCILTPVIDDSRAAENKLVVVARDVTDQERIDETNARLAAIVENSDDAIVGKDPNGIVTSWNRGAERLFGYTAEEMIGQSIERIIPVDRRGEEPEILEKLRAGERIEHFESVRIAKDGQFVDVSLTISPIRDESGRITGASKIVHDMTDRRRADSANARLAAIVESSDDSIISEDLNGLITTWNAGAQKLFGYTAEETVGRPVDSILLSPDDPKEVKELLAQTLRGEPVRNFDTRRLRKAGSIVDVSVTVSLIRDPHDNVIGVARIHRDITQRLKAEAARRESDRLARSVLDSLPDHIAVLDEHGVIIAVNQAWRDFALANDAHTSVSEGADYLAACAMARGGDVAGAIEFASAIREMLAGERAAFEIEYPCHSPNEHRWFLGRLTPFQGDGPRRIVVSHHNITIRKLAEKRLREREHMLSQSQKMAHVGSWELEFGDLTNFNGSPLRWSDECYRIFGHEPSEGVESNDLFFRAIPEEDQVAIHSAIRRSINEGMPYEIVHRIRRPDGSERIVHEWGEVNGAFGQNGHPISMQGTCQDITERKLAEEALRLSEERLAMATQAAGIGTWDTDVESMVCEWSSLEAELFGFPANLLRVTYQDVLERIHPEDREVLERALALARETAGPYQLEFRVILPDGSIRWLANFGRFQYDHSGIATRIVGVSQEITARKHADEALRSSERNYVQMLESITDGFIALDADWRYSYLNPQAKNILGRDPSELLGRSLWDAYPDTVGSAFERCFRRAVTERVAVSFEEYYPEPLNKWFSVHAYPSADGLSVFFADVTDQRRAHEAVRLYANRLENLREIDLAILSAQSPHEIAMVALQHLARLVPCSAGAAALYSADENELELLSSVGAGSDCDAQKPWISWAPVDEKERQPLREGRAVVVDRISSVPSERAFAEAFIGPGLQSYVQAPLWDREEMIGLLCLGADTPAAYSGSAVEIIREVADHLAIAMRQSLLRDEILSAKDRLETMSRRLILAEEAERRRIARELHDETGQGLVALKINLNAISRNPAALTTQHRINECLVIVDRTIAQVRNLSVHLRPTLLDDFGLVISLKTYCDGLAQRLGINIDFIADPSIGRCDPEVETACYRIVQEALNNITKYAKASEVRVLLERRRSDLIVEIGDNGLGFDVATARARATCGSSFGVLGMEERATLVGGSLTIQSEAGHGTLVRAVLPF